MASVCAVRWLTVLLVASVACSSSSSPASPNKTPGQCVLSDGVWYCGAGYGNLTNCPSDAILNASCDYDGGSCFSCYYESAGAVFSCGMADGGGRVWNAIPSGTGCSQ
jgi:hypothetical protein